MYKKESKGDRFFLAVNTVLLTLFVIAVAYPLLFIISSSLSSTDAVISGHVWLFPVDFSLDGYKAVLEYNPVWTGYLNSLFYTTVGTVLNVAFTLLAAYPLSRKGLKGKKAVIMGITFTILFSGGIIPNYLLVQSLGMVNTRWALLIPNLIAARNVIIARTFFQANIGDELLEAAKMDGCSDFRFFGQIVIPLSGAVVAVIALFYAVDHWNAYFDALIYLRDRVLFPLQIFLREVLVMNEIDVSMVDIDLAEMQERLGMRELLKYALIIVSSLPVLIMYPFAQKYFVKGVMMGSLKG